jgi:hypothetical protein
MGPRRPPLFKIWRISRQIRLSNKLELQFPSSIESSPKINSNSVLVPLKLRNNNNKINYTERLYVFALITNKTFNNNYLTNCKT